MAAEPDYDAVELFWVQGVVRNGQVVLDPPLALPDGTVVTVTKYDPDENPFPEPAGPAGPFTEAQVQEMMVRSFCREDLIGDPDWKAKLREFLHARNAQSVADRNGHPAGVPARG